MIGYLRSKRQVVAVVSAFSLVLAVAGSAFCAGSAAPDATVTDGLSSVELTLAVYLAALVVCIVALVPIGIGIKFIIKGAKMLLRTF